MAMNPASLIKMMGLKNKFEKNHPKFMAYIQAVFSRPIEEGTVLEVTVTRPGEQPMTANILVNAEDIELFRELKSMN